MSEIYIVHVVYIQATLQTITEVIALIMAINDGTL